MQIQVQQVVHRVRQAPLRLTLSVAGLLILVVAAVLLRGHMPRAVANVSNAAAAKAAAPATSVYSFSNGGYRYSMRFYAGSKVAQMPNGYNGILRNGGQAVVTARPAQLVTFVRCSQVGQGWLPAMNINVEGGSQPLCTTQERKNFLTVINHNGQQHLVLATYQQAQATGADAQLRQTFESFKVSP